MVDKRIRAVKLNFDNVSCLRTASALNDVELNALAFFKSLITVHLNRGEMYEHVAALFCLDEAITLLSVKPFNFSLHLLNIPFIIK